MKHLLLLFLIIPFFLFCSAPETKKKTISNKEIIVTDGWARPGKTGMMSAAYFKLINGTSTADTLLRIESNASPNTQIHRSFQTEDGLMGMEEQPFVLIPAQSEVEFKQGGLHVMIIQPEKDLIDGDSISLKLYLSSSKILDVNVPVKSF